MLLNAEILRSKEKQEENNERCSNKEYFICALINVEKVVWLLIHSVPLLRCRDSSPFAGWLCAICLVLCVLKSGEVMKDSVNDH